MATSTSERRARGSVPLPTVPALEAGDQLTRDEFERRYAAMPALKKAELIEGVVYMPSPVRVRRHGSPHAKIIGWLIHYQARTPGVEVADNAAARLDMDNEPQPDAMLFIAPELGGQVRISPDDYVEAAPELVAEVASSSASYDLNTKRHAYRRSGVQEYIVWRVLEQQLDWFILRGGRYEPLAADDRGLVRSATFPGLWLDPAALLRGDLAATLQILDEGLSTPEHAAFATRLAAAGA
ncbi:MAG: Uma2 family endonuclease [Pirellulaceae bacterium]|nr:Uma2 family endonuclease [Pirellulaceae bacterium]